MILELSSLAKTEIVLNVYINREKWL